MGFYEDWNSNIPDFTKVFGSGEETWTIDSTKTNLPVPTGGPWPVVSVDKRTFSSKVMRGGEFVDRTTEIYIDLATFTASGVKKGMTLVLNNGDRYLVLEVDNDGDAMRTLICVSSQTGGILK